MCRLGFEILNEDVCMWFERFVGVECLRFFEVCWCMKEFLILWNCEFDNGGVGFVEFCSVVKEDEEYEYDDEDEDDEDGDGDGDEEEIE